MVTKLQAGTWAAIAATPTSERNVLVVHRPTNGAQHTAQQSGDEDGVHVAPSEARVVWIKPKDADTVINAKMVTKVISQGPLYSIAYSRDDHAICVIFQDPKHAQAFLDHSVQIAKTKGYGVLGPRYDILPGQGYSNDGELKRMEFPKNERRRLTFVRSALFSDGLTEEMFKKDIYGMVGEEHVELVWLFNTGNGKESVLKCKQC